MVDPCTEYADWNAASVLGGGVCEIVVVMVAPDDVAVIGADHFPTALSIPPIPVETGTLTIVPVPVIGVLDVFC
jgi:hypothetical protein